MLRQASQFKNLLCCWSKLWKLETLISSLIMTSCKPFNRWDDNSRWQRQAMEVLSISKMLLIIVAMLAQIDKLVSKNFKKWWNLKEHLNVLCVLSHHMGSTLHTLVSAVMFYVLTVHSWIYQATCALPVLEFKFLCTRVSQWRKIISNSSKKKLIVAKLPILMTRTV